MRDLFRELPEACDNTLLIAERANVEIAFGDAAARAAEQLGPGRPVPLIPYTATQIEDRLRGALSAESVAPATDPPNLIWPVPAKEAGRT